LDGKYISVDWQRPSDDLLRVAPRRDQTFMQ
jgi:hypothetical protein